MLDADLAEIYGYSTKTFNQQVKNNADKFDEDFRFRLTKDEKADLRSKNLTSSWGGSRYLPYAFTEQGIYMLMTVLKGDLATKQSKALIYTQAQHSIYIVDNYIGIKTLEQLINTVAGVEIKIFSDNLFKGLRKSAFVDFCKEYPSINIKLYKSGGAFHDRYIILDYGTEDEKIFHCGASSKDAGTRVTSILEDFDREKYAHMISELLEKPTLLLK